jgi:hypothetical protein
MNKIQGIINFWKNAAIIKKKRKNLVEKGKRLNLKEDRNKVEYDASGDMKTKMSPGEEKKLFKKKLNLSLRINRGKRYIKGVKDLKSRKSKFGSPKNKGALSIKFRVDRKSAFGESSGERIKVKASWKKV